MTHIEDRKNGVIFRMKRLAVILKNVPQIYHQRLTHRGVEKTKAARDVYYSTIFAFGSAAIAFISTSGSNHNKETPLLIVSAICFGIAFLLVIFIYFLRILHTLSWEYFSINTEGKNTEESVNKDTAPSVIAAMNDSFDLMVIGGYLDLLLLIALIGALVTYCGFTVINL